MKQSEGLFSKILPTSPRQYARILAYNLYKHTPSTTQPKKTKPMLQKLKSILIFLIICITIFLMLKLSYHQLLKHTITNIYNKPLLGHLPHLKYYSTSFQQYLHKKNIHTLLQISCTLSCLLKQKEEYMENIKRIYVNDISENIFYHQKNIQDMKDIDDMHNIKDMGDSNSQINNMDIMDMYRQNQYVDWINYNQFHWYNLAQQQLISLIRYIKSRTKIGLSLTYQLPHYNKFNKQQLHKIRQLFKQYGLHYNQIDSLTLRRIQGHVIQIYNPINKNIHSTKQNQINLLAIQVQVNLQDDLSYLKQWIGYHVSIGVNKIFVYDVTNIYDVNQGNGYGSSGRCIGLSRDQQLVQWQKIWKDYRYNIIYIPYNYYNISQNYLLYFLSYFTDISLTTQHDYIYYYKNEINYTIFLKSTNQLIYSTIGVKLSNSIQKLQRQQYNVIRLQYRYFVHRLCSYFNTQVQKQQKQQKQKQQKQKQQKQDKQKQKQLKQKQQQQQLLSMINNKHKYMLHNFFYYDTGIYHTQYQYIYKTNQYQPNWGKQNGKVNHQYIHIFWNRQWKINSYTITKSNIKILQQQIQYPNLYLSYDFNAENRIILAERMCQSGCFIDIKKTCLEEKKIQCPQPLTKLYVENF